MGKVTSINHTELCQILLPKMYFTWYKNTSLPIVGDLRSMFGSLCERLL